MICCWRAGHGSFAHSSSKSPLPQLQAEYANQIPILWASQALLRRCHESHLLFFARDATPMLVSVDSWVVMSWSTATKWASKKWTESWSRLMTEWSLKERKEVKIFKSHRGAELIISSIIEGENLMSKCSPGGAVAKVTLTRKAVSSQQSHYIHNSVEICALWYGHTDLTLSNLLNSTTNINLP